jgi:hypothetical protein
MAFGVLRSGLLKQTRSAWTLRLLVVALSLGLRGEASGQVTTADIVGRVTDTTGGVLPGATVTVENVATREVRAAPSNETGDFLFNLLPIGAYAIQIDLQGFTSQITRVTLSTGDRVRIDAKLQVRQLTENVTVAAELPLLQTDSATVSTLVTNRAVQDFRSAAATCSSSCSSCRAPSKDCPIRSRAAHGPTIADRRRRFRSTVRSTTRTIS